MAKVVQFVGIENVVEAFVNRNCCMWSLWVDRQFLFSYIGADNQEAADNLQETLERLEKNRGIYTLKVYTKVKDAECISEKDACHGSFNFRMMAYEGDGDGATPYYRSLRDEINALKAERQTLLDELGDRDENEDGGLLGKLGSMFMEDPAKLPLMLQSIQGVLSMFTKQTTQTGQPGPVALSGIADQQQKAAANNELLTVIAQLQQKDPQLLKHLKKLASLPDPVFMQLVSMLDTM
jgi:hypothetical protein